MVALHLLFLINVTEHKEPMSQNDLIRKNQFEGSASIFSSN